jgi:hypothetical protein
MTGHFILNLLLKLKIPKPTWRFGWVPGSWKQVKKSKFAQLGTTREGDGGLGEQIPCRGLSQEGIVLNIKELMQYDS